MRKTSDIIKDQDRNKRSYSPVSNPAQPKPTQTNLEETIQEESKVNGTAYSPIPTRSLLHDSDNNICIQLSDEIKKEGFVESFSKDKRTNSLLLTLNHVCKRTTIMSPVYANNQWHKTVEALVKKLKNRGLNDKYIDLIEDALNSDFEHILGLSEDIRENGDHNLYIESNQQKPSRIRKYSGNGTLSLHESVVFRDGQVAFLSLDANKKPRFEAYIERPDKTFIPADSLDSNNPLPYIFESPEELEQYLGRAGNETFDSLFQRVKHVYRRYVNAEEHHLSILSADTIHSYFQDKFATLHYNIFVGDNGSGKNSALLVYRFLGYRVFYVVAASAPNYFTFLGESEECQGTIAEDEAEDIGYNKDKQKIFKSGSASGGSVPKVDLTYGRTQGSYSTFCMKWLAMEQQPDYKKIKGVLDRSFIFRFVVGDVDYNIKDVTRYAGDAKFKPLHDELMDLRKLLFAFRMIHYDDVIPDLDLNIKHRNAELTKPLLRLFSSRNDAPIALEEIRHALSKFITERNELKRNSIEFKLLETVNNLIERRQSNPDSDESKALGPYSFYNQDIWAEVKDAIDGQEIPFKSESVYTVEYGSISHKHVTSLYKSKFNARPFKVGNGGETRRGLIFSKEVLDRLTIHYDVPDEIAILNQTEKRKKVETHRSATDATDATHSRNGDGIISDESMNANDTEGDTNSLDAMRLSASANPAHNIEANATSITRRIDTNSRERDQNDHRDGVSPTNNDNNTNPDNIDSVIRNSVSNNSTSINGNYYNNSDDSNNDKLATMFIPSTINEKEASSFSTSVASVASVADKHNENSDIQRSTTPIIDAKSKTEGIRLPTLSCLWCDYKDPIEFDLGNHLLANHKLELLKLPIGKAPMETRIDHAIQWAKRKMRMEYADDDDEDDNEDNDSNDDYE